MGPIYGQPEFLIWYRYDNTGEKEWGVLEGEDADQAIGRLRWHACPLPLTILSVEPWTEDQPLPGEGIDSAASREVASRSSSRAICFRVPAPISGNKRRGLTHLDLPAPPVGLSVPRRTITS